MTNTKNIDEETSEALQLNYKKKRDIKDKH